jgi:predicted oxidoreductase
MIQFCAENGNQTPDHAGIYRDYTTEVTFGKGLIKSGGLKSQYLANF